MIGCDLGSNTFRVVEIDCESKQRLREFERIVKTAENIAHTGVISDAAVDRVCDAILEAKQTFDLSNAKAVATAAMRKASNKAEVLQTIVNRTGLLFEIIDASQEAAYAKKAAHYALGNLKLETDDFVMMDLGGGSTELVFQDSDISFDVGIVTIVDKYSLEQIYEGIETELKPIQTFIERYQQSKPMPKRFVATAGTPTTIAAFLQGMDYDTYDYQKINGTILTIAKIDQALERLLALDPQERVRWVGVGRDDLIIAGTLLFKEIMASLGFDEAIVIDDGLREGVALSGCEA